MKHRITHILRLVSVSLAAPALAGSSDLINTANNAQIDADGPVLTNLVEAGSEAQRADVPGADGTAGEVAPGLLPQREPHKGVDENMFKGHNWYTPPPPAPRRTATKPVNRAPVAPPLPYELLGSYEQAGSPTLYFLVKDDRIYDVTIGDTLDNTYRVDKVSRGQLMFTYLPLKTSQGLRLGD